MKGHDNIGYNAATISNTGTYSNVAPCHNWSSLYNTPTHGQWHRATVNFTVTNAGYYNFACFTWDRTTNNSPLYAKNLGIYTSADYANMQKDGISWFDGDGNAA